MEYKMEYGNIHSIGTSSNPERGKTVKIRYFLLENADLWIIVKGVFFSIMEEMENG